METEKLTEPLNSLRDVTAASKLNDSLVNNIADIFLTAVLISGVNKIL